MNWQKSRIVPWNQDYLVQKNIVNAKSSSFEQLVFSIENSLSILIMLKMVAGATGNVIAQNNNQTDLLDLVPTDLSNPDHSRRSGFTFGQRNHNRWEICDYVVLDKIIKTSIQISRQNRNGFFSSSILGILGFLWFLGFLGMGS